MARTSSDHFFACYNSQGRASGNKKWKGYTQYRLVLIKSINSLCNPATPAYWSACGGLLSIAAAAYGKIIASLLDWVGVWEILKALLLYIARFPRTLRDRSKFREKMRELAFNRICCDICGTSRGCQNRLWESVTRGWASQFREKAGLMANRFKLKKICVWGFEWKNRLSRPRSAGYIRKWVFTFMREEFRKNSPES